MEFLQFDEFCRVVDTDAFLSALVSFANRTGLGLGLTVQVGGYIVSGRLVGGREYFKGLPQTVSTALTIQAGLDSNAEASADLTVEVLDGICEKFF